MGNFSGTAAANVVADIITKMIGAVSDGHRPPPVGPSSGIILLGNTGVGKSLLANILLKEDVFAYECSPSSVTHEIEYRNFSFNQGSYVVFNVPGLIESNQPAIDRNKTEIQRAFEQCPNSIIASVFNGGSAGRLREDDIVAFNALNAAYQFKPESLFFVINDLPTKRSAQYEGETILKLEHLLNISNVRICFLDHIDTSSRKQKIQLREKMLQHITTCVPHVHEKHKDIILLVDIIKNLEADAKTRQDEFNKKMESMHQQIQEQQRQYHQQLVALANQREKKGLCTIL